MSEPVVGRLGDLALPRALRLASLLCVFIVPSAMGGSYDVSYLWHPDLSSVTIYKNKLASILGPDMARRLSVVRGSDNYGVVYPRHGDLGATAAVAKAHSRILLRQGLERAIPIPSQDWARADSAQAGPAAAPEPSAHAPSSLEADIESYIKQLRRRGHVRGDERTAWLVYDLSSDEKLASINEDIPLEAASLIKPFIALAWFHEVEAGRKTYTSALRDRMESMIRESDNRAADWFMRRLGGPSGVQRLLSVNYGALLRNTRIVEYIPASGRTYRNKASAHDYSRFLYALWHDSLPRSGEIKRLMNLPNADRLYTSTPGVPAGTEVYDKTGTTGHLCGDMGILVARRDDGAVLPYIVVGVIEKANAARGYFGWMRSRGDVIRRISEMAFEAVSGRHELERADPVSGGGLAQETDGGKAGKNNGGRS